LGTFLNYDSYLTVNHSEVGQTKPHMARGGILEYLEKINQRGVKEQMGLNLTYLHLFVYNPFF
jgi:hypothetical protein